MTTPPCHALETQPFSGCSWGGPLVGGPPPLSLPAAFVGLALSSPRDCCAALRRAWDLRLLYPHELPGSPRCLPSLSVAALPPCRASLNYGSSAGEGGACRTRHVHARSASAVHWGGGCVRLPIAASVLSPVPVVRPRRTVGREGGGGRRLCGCRSRSLPRGDTVTTPSTADDRLAALAVLFLAASCRQPLDSIPATVSQPPLWRVRMTSMTTSSKVRGTCLPCAACLGVGTCGVLLCCCCVSRHEDGRLHLIDAARGALVGLGFYLACGHITRSRRGIGNMTPAIRLYGPVSGRRRDAPA